MRKSSARDATCNDTERRRRFALAEAVNSATSPEDAFYLPQIGVEIVDTQMRNGNQFP